MDFIVSAASFLKWRVQFRGTMWLSLAADGWLGWYYHRHWGWSFWRWVALSFRRRTHPWSLLLRRFEPTDADWHDLQLRMRAPR